MKLLPFIFAVMGGASSAADDGSLLQKQKTMKELTCSDFQCPKNFHVLDEDAEKVCKIKREVAPSGNNRNFRLVNVCTLPQCCTEMMSCKNNDTTATWGKRHFQCPTGFTLKDDAEFMGYETRDIETCCQSPCEDHTCPSGFTNNLEAVCEAGECTNNECCTQNPTCETHTCPTGQSRRDSKEPCAGRKCSTDECCEPRCGKRCGVPKPFFRTINNCKCGKKCQRKGWCIDREQLLGQARCGPNCKGTCKCTKDCQSKGWCGPKFLCKTRDIWSAEKTEWCCENENLGCPDCISPPRLDGDRVPFLVKWNYDSKSMTCYAHFWAGGPVMEGEGINRYDSQEQCLETCHPGGCSDETGCELDPQTVHVRTNWD